MALVRVFWPQSESEALVAAALLDAHGIPMFVHNRGIAGMLPGVQVNGYNTQSIMVPERHVEDALEVLAQWGRSDPVAPSTGLPARDRLRIVLETLLFGWFIPGSRMGGVGDSSRDDESTDD